MKTNLSSFYDQDSRLEYHPQALFKKRKGLRKLIAYDDRFEQVKVELEDLIKRTKSSPVKILDIGVGDAIYESNIEGDLKRRCKFYGVDISAKQIARAKKFLHFGKVLNLDSQKLPFPKEFFDLVIASEILEHVFYPEKILKESRRVLKRRGFLLLTFPNSGSLHIRLSILFSGRSPLINYHENKEHIRFFTTFDIQKMLGKDFRLIKIKGLGSFFFDKWNFFFKIPMPRIMEVLGNKVLPNLALGNLLISQKQ